MFKNDPVIPVLDVINPQSCNFPVGCNLVIILFKPEIPAEIIVFPDKAHPDQIAVFGKTPSEYFKMQYALFILRRIDPCDISVRNVFVGTEIIIRHRADISGFVNRPDSKNPGAVFLIVV